MAEEFYDRTAAIAGRVHRRRVERRVYPKRKKEGWNTADYVRAYFTLNTRQPSFLDAGSGIYAYRPGEHTELYQTLGRAAQDYEIDQPESTT